MKISFIGAGRVAHHLAQALCAQHQIIQIYSRTFSHAQTLAEKVGAQGISSFAALDPSIDLLVIAVSDHAIAEVAAAVHAHLPDVLVVHTSGSTDLNVLTQAHARAGVFYPLQTFSIGRDMDWRNTPLLVEATHETDQQSLVALAQQLSERVYAYSSAQRLSLHLAAVFACNFSNYCYDMAQQLVDQRQVDFSLLYPLMLETAQKATLHVPQSVQTGPAMRGDQHILTLHQQMLEQAERPDLAEVYALLSQQIQARQ